MAKVKFLIKNEKGQDVQKTSKEITTKDYRDYLILNEALSSDVSEVEKLDKQLEFIASLFEDLEVEELLKFTDMADILRYLQTSTLISWVMLTQRRKTKAK